MKRKIKRRKCQICKRTHPSVKRRRQGSAYVNDKFNFATLCEDCQKETHEYWVGMWNEYYSTIMD